MYNSRGYLFNLFFAVLLPVAGGIDLIFRHDAAWQRVVGALLLIVVVIEIALFVRWWRRPVDAEAFDQRNRLRVGWMFDRKQRVPPRSKW